MLDYPESAHFQKARAKIAWGEWLATCRPWDWFVTLTARSPSGDPSYTRRGIAYCRKLVESFELAVLASGPPAANKGMEGVYAIERHASGAPHIHGLTLGWNARRLSVMDQMWEKWGMARIELVRDRGAAFYVAKYILKDDRPENLILRMWS